MARKYFGTDGIRGKVGEPPIPADFLLKLGWAAGQVFALFVIGVAAAASVVGLVLIIAVYRLRRSVFMDDINLLKW